FAFAFLTTLCRFAGGAVTTRPRRPDWVDIGPMDGSGRRETRRRRTGALRADPDGGGKGATRAPRRDELHVDRAAARIADAHLGNCHRDQLIAIGLSPRAIENWVERGRLHRQFRSVYALGHRALPPFSREMAAVMACRSDSFLSHDPAGHVWGFRPAPADGLIDVTVVGRHVRGSAGIRVHYSRELMDRDRRRHEGIPITSPARTLIDIAPSLDDRELELALHEAIATRTVTMGQVRAALSAYPRRRGTARLAQLVRAGGPLTVTHKGSEEQLYRALRAARLPRPLTNHRIGRFQA